MQTDRCLSIAAGKLNRIVYPRVPGLHYWKSIMHMGFLCAILFLLPSYPAFADSPSTSAAREHASAQNFMEEGMRAYHQGAFGQAVSLWLEAARFYQAENNPDKASEALIHLAHAYRSLGQYENALKNLELALALAEESGDKARTAYALGSLGDAYVAMGSEDKAFQYLNEGLKMARVAKNSALSAVILNNLGNLFTSQNNYSKAVGSYKESLKLAEETGNRALAARAQINAAMASIQNDQSKEANALLDMALDQIRGLGDSHDKAYGLINIGLGYHELRPHLPDASDSLLLLAAKTFNEALIVAENVGDLRAVSYALGHLGRLYEEERRYQEALELTRRAIFAAQQVNAPESIFRWQWQMGRLLKALEKNDDAISAYRRTVHTLQSIRQEISKACMTGYSGTRSSFREFVGPVYFELVDLLLQRAASTQIRKQYEPYLLEVRETVELFKAAELRDYFQDNCVDAGHSRITRLDVVSQTAVVVYPILLPDRIELLVSLPNGMKRFSVQVGADAIRQEVRAFRSKLEKRTTREFLSHAQTLYDWLIRPMEPDLKSLTIDTLVFVPDGPLRTVPMTALHDGHQFLISRYAVAVTPGLDLTDPRSIKQDNNLKVLTAGLTESVQGFPSLPNVSEELEAIQSLYGVSQLLNQNFLASSLAKELKGKEFNVVHIASHGQFEGNVEKSFLLTFDDKLTIDRLSQYVGLFRYRDNPLELLTLSACDTAAGDDRAALGLAGIAIKAGARSAVATLWTINDRASSMLIAEFYRQLQAPSVSRAIALQRAQLTLLDDRRYQHPGYWSPFLLINNWL